MAFRGIKGGINYSAREGAVTTDPEEGRRQIEVMKPEPLKVGDKVRLRGGGPDWVVTDLLDDDRVRGERYRGEYDRVSDTFPVRSLVRIDK